MTYQKFGLTSQWLLESTSAILLRRTNFLPTYLKTMALEKLIDNGSGLRQALLSEGWTNDFGAGPPLEIITFAVYRESWLVDQKY